MSFIRTLTQENLICCGIGHTELLFSEPRTSIHPYASAAWLSGDAISSIHYKVTLASLSRGTYPCRIISLLQLYPAACPEIGASGIFGHDIKIYHKFPSARQRYALPGLR